MTQYVRDYYDLLGVERNAHSDDIKSAYRTKVRIFHPDKAASSTNLENPQYYKEYFNQLQVAYQTLIDSDLRAQYDSNVPTKQNFLSIEADDTFKAFDFLRKYKEHEDILDMLPKLEKQYGEISFKEGISCIPLECFRHFLPLSTSQYSNDSKNSAPRKKVKNPIKHTQKRPRSRPTTSIISSNSGSEEKNETQDLLPIKKEKIGENEHKIDIKMEIKKELFSDEKMIDENKLSEENEKVIVRKETEIEKEGKKKMKTEENEIEKETEKIKIKEEEKEIKEQMSKIQIKQEKEEKNLSINIDKDQDTHSKNSQKKVNFDLSTKKEKKNKPIIVLPSQSLNEKRILLCQKHKYLHVCDSECTSETEKCEFWAQFLAYEWMKVNIFSWEPHTSKSNRKYWFNPFTGQSVWSLEDWVKKAHIDPKHQCTMTTCSKKFSQLDREGSLWVCALSGKAHICTFLQCKHVQQSVAGRIVCWATEKEYFSSIAETEQEELLDSTYQSHHFAQMKETTDLANRKRRLTYVNDNGRKVDLLVDVPFGLDIGESVDSSEREGKKRYELIHQQKERFLALQEERDRFMGEDYEEGMRDSDIEDKDSPTRDLEDLEYKEQQDEEEHNLLIKNILKEPKRLTFFQVSNDSKKKIVKNKINVKSEENEEIKRENVKKERKINRYKEEEEEVEEEEESETEELYENVENPHPFYDKYVAPIIDFRDHAEEEEGDYRTIGETVEGENGGFETLIEQDQDEIEGIDLFSSDKMLLEDMNEKEKRRVLLKGPDPLKLLQNRSTKNTPTTTTTTTAANINTNITTSPGSNSIEEERDEENTTAIPSPPSSPHEYHSSKRKRKIKVLELPEAIDIHKKKKI